jgi:L-arabinose isomerase
VRTPDLLTAFQYLIQFAMRGRRNTNARVQNNEEIKRTLNKHVASSRGLFGLESALGHYWHDVPRLEGLFVRLLTGQGVYIIAEGNPEEAHEYVNLERIVRLLHSVSSRLLNTIWSSPIWLPN